MANELLASNDWPWVKSCGIEGCAQHMEVSYSLRKKVELFKHLNDAYIILIAILATCKIKLRWNELLCSQKIVNQLFERRNVLQRQVAMFCKRFSWTQKLQFLLLCIVARYICNVQF